MNNSLFLFNGAIYTPYNKKRFSSCLYCLNDKIVFVGDNEDNPFFKKADIEIDLKGRLVLPGFIDCHTHFSEYAINKFMVDLTNVTTFDEAILILKNKIAITPLNEWITGWGWDKNRWGFIPDKKHLDQLSDKHFIVLSSKDGHSLWCNTMALNISELYEHPTGILYEDEGNVVRKKIKKPGKDIYLKYIEEAINEAHKYGLTGIHICENPFEFSIYQELQKRNKLTLRTVWHFPMNKLEEVISLRIMSNFGNNYLKLGCVKIFLDGSLGSQTAYMFDNYIGLDSRGIILMDEDKLVNIIIKANSNGINCAVHAIGDRANNIALNAFEKAKGLVSQKYIRNRIEHAQLINPVDIKRFSLYNIIASVQPLHIINDIQIAEKYWGKRSCNAYPFNSLLKSGTCLIFGSDVPVEHFNPILGIYSAISRKNFNNPQISEWYPDEIIKIEDAIKAYTLNAAYSSYDENNRGDISIGKFADLVVLDKNIFNVPFQELLETSVDITISGGKIVFKK